MSHANFSFTVSPRIVAKQENDEAYPPFATREELFPIYLRKKQRFHEINHYKVRLLVGSKSGLKQLKKINRAGLGCTNPNCVSGNNCGAYCSGSPCVLNWGCTTSGWTADLMGACGSQYVNCVSGCGLVTCPGCNC